VHESRQYLCHSSPYLRDTTGLRNPRLTTLLDKKHAVGTQRIAGEKNYPLTEGRQLPLEQPVQVLPIECWHQQVTEDQIKAPLMKQCECLLTVRGSLDGVTIPLE